MNMWRKGRADSFYFNDKIYKKNTNKNNCLIKKEKKSKMVNKTPQFFLINKDTN